MEPKITELLELADATEREQESARHEALLQLADEAEQEQESANARVSEAKLALDRARRNRRRKYVLTAVAVFLLLSIVVSIAVVYTRLLGRVKLDPGTRPSGYTSPNASEAHDPDFPAMYDITDASDLEGFLRQWWYNGGEDKIRYSKDVFNVLLLGEDNPDGSEYGRSDSIMLVSVNKKNRTVSMLSFLRDSYCYMNVNGQEHWARLNAAYNLGGPAEMMEAVTRLYKIRVDKYVSVNFSGFKKLIDTLGGVTVDVTAQEARYINRTAPSMNRSFPSGEGVRLNGAQALVYCRIRKLDSDNARTMRQQKVIQAIIASARGASLGRVYDALEGVLAHVSTNFSQGEITALIPQAIGWLRYGTQQFSSPLVHGSNRSAIGAVIHGAQVWVVDYPFAAQQVQMALYGESNINIEVGGERSDYIINLFRGAADRGTLERDSYRGGTATTAAPAETAQTAPSSGESETDGGEWLTSESLAEHQTEPESATVGEIITDANISPPPDLR